MYKTSEVSENHRPNLEMKSKRRQWDASGQLNQDVSLDITSRAINGDYLEDDDVMKPEDLLSVEAGRRGEDYDEKFCVEQVPNGGSFETIMSNLLEQFLTNVEYDPSTCHDLSHNLAARIMEKIKQLRLRRYKYVTVVSIGSQNERSAMHFGSRCLWDQDVDNFTTVKFTNSSLFAVAMIYGLQFE